MGIHFFNYFRSNFSMSQNCSICSFALNSRGGRPLICPSVCCDAVFHADCFQHNLAEECPNCKCQTKQKNIEQRGGESSKMSIVLVPEFKSISFSAMESFYLRCGIKHDVESSKKSAIDLICVLDSSGSMSGDKIYSLKDAMSFIIGSLGDDDSLAIVNFNDQAHILHSFLKMTEANKYSSRHHMDQLQAGGGTNILHGMQVGFSLSEQQQRSRNKAFFLLTDGQDTNNLPAKKALAKQIKDCGSSLFVFGFGRDHDSAQMSEIANAAEGSFTYVETDDAVVDAFGGAIGTTQGSALQNISLNIAAAEGVELISTVSGNYLVTASPDRRRAIVSFASLYVGEFRDVLVQVNVPAVTAAASTLLVSASASFSAERDMTAGGISSRVSCRSVTATASVARQQGSMSSFLFSQVRDITVDVQINRNLGLKSIASALKDAESSNLDKARASLKKALAIINSSPSLKAGDRISKAVAVDLEEALEKVKSEDVFRYGCGGHILRESYSSSSRQRSCYTKMGKFASYQSPSSCAKQEEYSISKSSKRWGSSVSSMKSEEWRGGNRISDLFSHMPVLGTIVAVVIAWIISKFVF